MDKEKLLQKIGDRIRELREKQGISQAELGRRCDQGSSWMHRIESGQINSSIHVLYVVAQALGVKLSEIIDVD